MKVGHLFVLFLAPYIGAVSAQGITYTFTNGKLMGPETIAMTGYVEVHFQNDSDQPYEIVIDRLAEGKTLADLKVAIDAVVEAFASPEKMPAAFQHYYDLAASLGGVTAAPGTRATFGVLLEAGTHVASIVCAGCPPNADKSLVLTVSEGASASAPTPDLTIELSDFHVSGLPDELSAGTYLWEMTNSGQQGHFLGLFQLAKGKTQDDFLAWAASAGPEGPSGPPPGIMAGGSNFITGGQRYYYSVELSPGTYVAYCPVQDMFSGTPHDALGMLQTFTVR